MTPYENTSGPENSSPKNHISLSNNSGIEDAPMAERQAIIPSSSMSATVVVFIIAGILLLLFTKFDHRQSLISYYDEKEDFSQVLPVVVTGNMAAASASLIAAPDHTQSLHYLYQQLIANPESDTLHYYIGACYFEAQDPVNAIRSFKKVIRNRHSGLKQKAEYKLGLAYLQSEDRVQAKAVFEKIARQSQHAYRDKALQILKEKQLF